MSGVVVHLPGVGGGVGGVPFGDPVTLRLGPGEVARFGRGSATTPVELRLDDAAISRLAGEIRVTDDHWQLSNHSATQSYLVENPEGAGEYLRVPPRRAGAPIPFEFSRVVLPTRRGTTVAFQVFAPDHVYLDPDGMAGEWGSRTVMAYSLDETALYFLVLVALCEPRLRDESPVAVPTTPQIVERLRSHAACGQLKARAVSSHIDYLAEEKMRISAPPERSSGAGAGAGAGGARRNGKREALVGIALRFGLVREEHLALLPPRCGRGTGGGDGAWPGRHIGK
ncbi:serine/threonine protein kinase [Streptomyces sp. NPDC059832]|uniref:serine/threonine protein kinase n=1 Tax=Streptomyces sp. NPDC059832 TaxID=3346966 RepID=UPI0036476DAA